MNRDFLAIKELDGELKFSHKHWDFGMTVSTREMVLQKPHVNYHIRLEDIVSIVPAEPTPGKSMSIVHERRLNAEIARSGGFSAGLKPYKCFVRQAVIHNRSGLFRLGPTDFVVPLADEVLASIVRYGGLHTVGVQPD